MRSTNNNTTSKTLEQLLGEATESLNKKTANIGDRGKLRMPDKKLAPILQQIFQKIKNPEFKTTFSSSSKQIFGLYASEVKSDVYGGSLSQLNNELTTLLENVKKQKTTEHVAKPDNPKPSSQNRLKIRDQNTLTRLQNVAERARRNVFKLDDNNNPQIQENDILIIGPEYNSNAITLDSHQYVFIFTGEPQQESSDEDSEDPNQTTCTDRNQSLDLQPLKNRVRTSRFSTPPFGQGRDINKEQLQLIDSLNDEAVEFFIEKLELEAVNKSSNQQLEVYKEHVKHIELKVIEIESQLIELKKQLDSEKSVVEQLQNTNEEQKSKIDGLSKNLNELEKAKTDEITELKQTNQRLEKELEELKSQKSSDEEITKQSEERIEGLEKQNLEYYTKIKDFGITEEQFEKNQEELKKKEQELKRLQPQLKQETDKNGLLETENLELKRKNEELENTKKEWLQKNELLTKQIKDNNKRLDEYLAEKYQLTDRLTASEQETGKIKKELEEEKNSKNELEKLYFGLAKEHVELNIKHETNHEELEAVKQKTEALGQEKESLKEQIAFLTDTLTELEQQTKNSLASELLATQEENNKIKALEEKVTNLKDQLSESKEYEGKVKNLEAELSQLEENKKELENKIGLQSEDLNGKLNQLSKQNEIINSLKSESEADKQKNEGLLKKISGLESQVLELEQQKALVEEKGTQTDELLNNQINNDVANQVANQVEQTDLLVSNSSVETRTGHSAPEPETGKQLLQKPNLKLIIDKNYNISRKPSSKVEGATAIQIARISNKKVDGLGFIGRTIHEEIKIHKEITKNGKEGETETNDGLKPRFYKENVSKKKGSGEATLFQQTIKERALNQMALTIIQDAKKDEVLEELNEKLNQNLTPETNNRASEKDQLNQKLSQNNQQITTKDVDEFITLMQRAIEENIDNKENQEEINKAVGQNAGFSAWKDDIKGYLTEAKSTGGNQAEAEAKIDIKMEKFKLISAQIQKSAANKFDTISGRKYQDQKNGARSFRIIQMLPSNWKGEKDINR